MDLHPVRNYLRPTSRAALPPWTPGATVLAGGTWLFSEPQPEVTQLVDLTALNWPALEITTAGLRIAATCTIAALRNFNPPATWRAGGLIGQCCEALLGSFKVWNAATVGGNICLALPAGPMTALATALQGVAEIWSPNGQTREMLVEHLVLDERRTALEPGEILRALRLPLHTLHASVAFRRQSLTPLGRSGALLIGTRVAQRFGITLTAATRRPVRLEFPAIPTGEALAERIDQAVSGAGLWHDDIHGAPDWRRHISLLFAEQIRAELA